jgi:threonyl-tRNA synthetase
MDKKLKDHKVIGKEQDLFTQSELVGAGLPLFTPKGALVRKLIEDYIYDLLEKYGYQHVWIPHLARKRLYEISGHLEKFKEDIFPPMKTKGKEYILKAMNCPHHIQIFKRKQVSYREMPQRYAETTTVYRSEQSGELGGLTRVLSITQDDAHVFCTKEQVEEEFSRAIEINRTMLSDFGFKNYWIRLSLWDPQNKQKYLGDEKIWNEMQNLMRQILKKLEIPFKEELGEAAFYGPKMDLIIQDAHKREWQLSTIQLDFNLPERFRLFYIDRDGKQARPYMLHRATFGSIERFLGVYLEHTQGSLPLWLSPIQVVIIPVSDKVIKQAKDIAQILIKEEIRVSIDDQNSTVSSKIRNNTLQKVPYLIIIGEKEVSATDENKDYLQTPIAARTREGENIERIKVVEFVRLLKTKIESRQ